MSDILHNMNRKYNFGKFWQEHGIYLVSKTFHIFNHSIVPGVPKTVPLFGLT